MELLLNYPTILFIRKIGKKFLSLQVRRSVAHELTQCRSNAKASWTSVNDLGDLPNHNRTARAAHAATHRNARQSYRTYDIYADNNGNGQVSASLRPSQPSGSSYSRPASSYSTPPSYGGDNGQCQGCCNAGSPGPQGTPGRPGTNCNAHPHPKRRLGSSGQQPAPKPVRNSFILLAAPISMLSSNPSRIGPNQETRIATSFKHFTLYDESRRWEENMHEKCKTNVDASERQTPHFILLIHEINQHAYRSPRKAGSSRTSRKSRSPTTGRFPKRPYISSIMPK